MIFAVIGAINGDLEALECALAGADEQGMLVILQTGNVAVGRAHSNEVVARLRERNILCVQGERDRELVRFARKPQSWRARWDEETLSQMTAASDAITSQHLEWLNTLPRARHLELEGTAICLCHGTPAAQAELLSPQMPLAKLERVREMDPAQVILCGGASESFSRSIGETLLCGIGPLRRGDGAVELCVVSTEEETARLMVQELAR